MAKKTVLTEMGTTLNDQRSQTAAVILIVGEGRTVLQEDGRPWPTEGLPDPDTLFSRRRKADGDLVVAPETQEVETGDSE